MQNYQIPGIFLDFTVFLDLDLSVYLSVKPNSKSSIVYNDWRRHGNYNYSSSVYRRTDGGFRTLPVSIDPLLMLIAAFFFSGISSSLTEIT